MPKGTFGLLIRWSNILSRSSAGNWNNYRRHLRALLQTAIEFKVIKENPFTKVKSVAHYPYKKYTQMPTIIIPVPRT
jgi:hypothetical protein